MRNKLSVVTYLSFTQAKRVGNPSEKKDSGQAGMTNNGFLTYEPINNSHQLSAISYQLSNAGFTLVELLITMAVFTFVIVAATSLFVPLLTQFKQQSKMAETNIEGVVGLDIMRRDIESAGYGLPWNIPSGTTYSEVLTAGSRPCGSGTTADPYDYNDATTNQPRAIVSGNTTSVNTKCTNGSDYLVIKAVNVATNASSSKWTELIYSATCTSPINSSCGINVCKRDWTPATEGPTSVDYVNVISPGTTSATSRLLMANSGVYGTTSAIQFDCNSIPSSWLPTSATDNIRLVYGLKGSGDAPKRPFNRADYYIRPLTTGELPRCATGTGVLEKATMDYSGGFTQLPLLDCVADMQVIYALDNDEDGVFNNGVGGDAYSNDISLLTAQNIRTRVKEVRVYILAHEGQKDSTYTSASSITVGEFSLGSTVSIGTNWQNYRWKLYTIVVKPMDLYK